MYCVCLTSHAHLSTDASHDETAREDLARVDPSGGVRVRDGGIEGRLRLAQQAEEPHSEHVQHALVARPRRRHLVRHAVGVGLCLVPLPQAQRCSARHVHASSQVLGHCHLRHGCHRCSYGSHRKSFLCS